MTQSFTEKNKEKDYRNSVYPCGFFVFLSVPERSLSGYNFRLSRLV